jgi:hypothetical protein
VNLCSSHVAGRSEAVPPPGGEEEEEGERARSPGTTAPAGESNL